ncbi:MAG: hypothetical protein AAB923_01580, partial [Patescibacteria group bacterium]
MRRRFITYLLLAAATLALAGGAYTFTRSFGVVVTTTIEACVANNSAKLACFEELTLTTLKRDGLAPALKLVAQLYEADRDFAA